MIQMSFNSGTEIHHLPRLINGRRYKSITTTFSVDDVKSVSVTPVFIVPTKVAKPRRPW